MTARVLVGFVMVQVVPQTEAIAKRLLHLDCYPYVYEPVADAAWAFFAFRSDWESAIVSAAAP
jgi:hypothetical protein